MLNTRLAILVILLMILSAPATWAYNNPTMKWYTITTPHFEVHYHEGAEWTARKVAEVAEEVHRPLTELYDYEPTAPVHFVIKDTNDYANGAAYFYDNRIEIWATNLEFGFRGTTDWIHNVVTHEYTHIISIQSSTKMPNWLPAVYFQAISFEQEKRADVLNGYPNVIVSYPFSGINMPPWFAEGVAQYQSPAKTYDCWDAHRDMILRSAVLGDKMLTYDEMGFFGKTSLQSEQVYDHGYGLVRYIASEYGSDAIRDIARGLKSFTRLNMDGALKDVTGKTGEELYADWKIYLQSRYQEQTADIQATPRTGDRIAPVDLTKNTGDLGEVLEVGVHNCGRCGMQIGASDGPKGFMTIAPAFSHDGNKIAFLSNKGSEYSGTALIVMDRDGKNEKTIKGGVSSPPRFSPDDRYLLYSKKVKINSYGATLNDMFVYDLEEKKERRVTKAARAADADWSRDGKTIIFVNNTDGTHRIKEINIDGSDSREVYSAGGGTQFYAPQVSPDGSQILFGIFKSATRDIAVIDRDGTGFRYMLESPSDERDARWARSGESIVFASDRSGIFNIYELDLNDDAITQHTNVLGGAFMPDMTPDGVALAYSGYSAAGYNIFYLDRLSDPVENMDQIAYAMRTAGPLDECESVRTEARLREAPLGTGLALASTDGAQVDQLALGQRSSDTAAGQAFDTSKYKRKFSPFQLYPRVLAYDGVARFGLFANSFEMLEQQAFFLGASYGTNGEYDAFVSYEIRSLYPTLFAEFFVVREKTNDGAIDEDVTSATFAHSFDFDLRYDLWQADFGLKFEFGPTLSLTHQNDITAYWSHGEYRVNVDGREFREDGSFLTSFDGGWKYYVGDQAHLVYNFRTLDRAVDAGINPRGGRAVTFHYFRSFDDLFENGEFAYGFRPIFSENHYNSFRLDWKEYVGLPWLRHSLRLRFLGTAIDENVDDFFWSYLGGLDGIRGYSFYSIGGRKGVLGSLTYRFPIFRNLNKQFMHLYFRDLYAGLFVETANAWDQDYDSGEFKTSVGYEFRLNLGSYYIFPTAISFASAYSFDPVSFRDPGFGNLPAVITQDRGFRYYFTLGFGFGL